MSTARADEAGYSIPCSVRGCRQETADLTGRPWQTATRAVHAARMLGWLYTRDGSWICPAHQQWDPRRGRWTAPGRTSA